jgi:hypothetical protein
MRIIASIMRLNQKWGHCEKERSGGMFQKMLKRLKRQRKTKTSRHGEAARRLRVEFLEERALLSADSALNVLDDVVQAPYADAESELFFDDYNIDYTLRTTGRVRILGNSGLEYYGDYYYCPLTDQVYIDLWERAIAHWEEVLAEGAPDVNYPHAVDGQTITIDDMCLYFGFTDSYASTLSLGTSLNNGYYRADGAGLPATGSLIFNAKYFVANPSETVQRVFYNTALHEIAHSLGYNLSYMHKLNVIETRMQTPLYLEDTLAAETHYWYYVGQKGVEQFQKTYPAEITSMVADGAFLMETFASSGSFGCHISSLYATYYFYLNQRDCMNYAISASYEATITPVTLGIMEDLGYRVDYAFADALNSPVPTKVTAKTDGADVLLTWQRGNGDLSAERSGAYYTVERCVDDRNIAHENRTWTVVADNLVEANYVDRSVKPNTNYLYRVYRNNVTAYSEICVTAAKEGDVISWTPSASSYRIYALVSRDSNKLAWTSVNLSVTDSSWTAEALTYKPFEKTALYRVCAKDSLIAQTAASRAARVTTEEFEAQCVQEGNAALLRAKSALGESEECEYWWDLTNAREINFNNFIQGRRELWFNPSASGYSIEERALARVMVKRGVDMTIEEIYLFQERVEPTFIVEAQTFLEGAAVALSITVPTGRAVAQWSIDWGEGAEPELFTELGYKLNAAHFYCAAPVNGLRAITLNVLDSLGYGGEEYVIILSAVNGQENMPVQGGSGAQEEYETSAAAQESAATQDVIRNEPIFWGFDAVDEKLDDFWNALRNSRQRRTN